MSSVEKKPSSSRRIILAVVVLGIAAAIIVVAYAVYTVLIEGGSGEASEEISAPTIDPQTLAAIASTQQAAAATSAAANATAAPTTNADLPPAPTTEPTEDASGNSEGQPESAVTPADAAPETEPLALFSIIPEESRVRFHLTEELRGQPTNVDAETDQVAGFIYIDVNNPANTFLGPIRINLRTLATSNDLRNRAIRSQILESAKDEYEFTEFIPTTITGLPTAVQIGTPITFQVTGDLKIREITNSVTFNVTVTPISETRIEGIGTAVVTRESYDLTIPNVPGVANVSQEVTLEIEFVAERTEETTEAPPQS